MILSYSVMKLSYNVSFSIAATFISAALLLVVSLYYSRSNLVNKRFKLFLASTIAMFLLDIGTVISNDYGASVPVWLNIILNSLYFASGWLVADLFFYYCVSVTLKTASANTRKKFYIASVSVLSLFVLLLILNAPFGFFFYFTPEGVYTHGAAFLAVHLPTLLFIGASLVLFIAMRKNLNRRQAVSALLFFASFFVSFALQIFAFPTVLLSDFGTAIGALIVFFSIETPDYVKLMATLNELNELKASLEIQVQNRTKELDEEKESYEELTLETLSSLAEVVDAKDHYTNGHSFRVASYAKALAEKVGLDKTMCEQIYFAGLIHDVGKIGISEMILRKPGKLSDTEFETIKSHSQIGGDILKGIHEFPVFEQVARSHHERYDGNGYPDKLSGEVIPYPARIVTICDTFDAMTSDRSYRKALSDETALEELKLYSGTQFDPKLAAAFIELYHSYPDSIRNHVEEIASNINAGHIKR